MNKIKKLFILLCVAKMFASVLGTSYNVYAIETKEQIQTAVLQDYFTKREMEFLNPVVTMSRKYEEVEVMGFGTEHILTFAKVNGSLQLVDDAYTEVTGYEAGTEVALATLNMKKELAESEALAISSLGEELIDEDEVQTNVAIASSYNSSAAVNYANTWCGHSTVGGSSSPNPTNYNPQFYYIPDADCCNFVSQCLYAGGMTMDSTWKANLNTSGTVTADPSLAQSAIAWRYTPSFQSYWEGKGYTVARITDIDQAKAGNPIFWLKSDGYSTNHLMMIVGTNSAGKVLVSGHNNDMYKYPMSLTSYTLYTLDLVHSYKNVISYNATTHTMGCTNCGTTQTSAHVFASTVALESTTICTVCGYTP